MTRQPERVDQNRSSRQRYQRFVQDYKQRQLDNLAQVRKDEKQSDGPANAGAGTDVPDAQSPPQRKRREYLREFLRWLRPHRYTVAALVLFALVVAGLEMIEPLFMRFIIDRVLLNDELDTAARLGRLQLAGAVFLGVIVLSK